MMQAPSGSSRRLTNPKDDPIDALSKSLRDASSLYPTLDLGSSRAVDFSTLKLRPGHEDRPLWVCPNGRIFLEVATSASSSRYNTSRYDMARDFLIAIAEPVSRPSFIHEYRLDKHALFASASMGMTADIILDGLAKLSKVPIAPSVEKFIIAAATGYGKAKLVLKKGRYFVESGYPAALRLLAQHPYIKAARVRIVGGLRTVGGAAPAAAIDDTTDFILGVALGERDASLGLGKKFLESAARTRVVERMGGEVESEDSDDATADARADDLSLRNVFSRSTAISATTGTGAAGTAAATAAAVAAAAAPLPWEDLSDEALSKMLDAVDDALAATKIVTTGPIATSATTGRLGVKSLDASSRGTTTSTHALPPSLFAPPRVTRAAVSFIDDAGAAGFDADVASAPLITLLPPPEAPRKSMFKLTFAKPLPTTVEAMGRGSIRVAAAGAAQVIALDGEDDESDDGDDIGMGGSGRGRGRGKETDDEDYEGGGDDDGGGGGGGGGSSTIGGGGGAAIVVSDDESGFVRKRKQQSKAPSRRRGGSSSGKRSRRGGGGDNEDEDGDDDDDEDYGRPKKGKTTATTTTAKKRISTSSRGGGGGGGGGSGGMEGIEGGVEGEEMIEVESDDSVGEHHRQRRRRGAGGLVPIDPELAIFQRLAASSNVASLFTPGRVESFEVDGAHTDAVRYAGLHMTPPMPLLSEYDYSSVTPGDSGVAPLLAADGRPATLFDAEQLRPYQVKCLAKMFGNGRARSGVIVLPCGAGKTLVGLTAAVTIGQSCMILCPNTTSVDQWEDQLKKYTTLPSNCVVKLTSKAKAELRPRDVGMVLLTTYSMIATGGRSATSGARLREIQDREWALQILDEVHQVVAAKFQRALKLKCHCRLGLTATLVREDGRESDLTHMLGPKLYEANWKDLTLAGYLANVQCVEVWCNMTPEFYKAYLSAPSVNVKKALAVMNPIKCWAMDLLLKTHRADKVIIFSESIFALELYACAYGDPVLTGSTPQATRDAYIKAFREPNSAVNKLFLSRVGDVALDVPDANVIIQISSHFGSRLQEAQRMGRILRKSTRGGPGANNSYFYSLLSTDTLEVFHGNKRRRYLVDQGYAYKVVQAVPGLQPTMEALRNGASHFSSASDRLKILQAVLNTKDVDAREAQEAKLFADFDAEDVTTEVSQQQQQQQSISGPPIAAAAFTRRPLSSLSALSGASGLRYLEYTGEPEEGDSGGGGGGGGGDVGTEYDHIGIDQRNAAMALARGGGGGGGGKEKEKKAQTSEETALEQALLSS